MAIITRITTKTRFETSDVPTQSEFVDLFDSVFMFADDDMDNIDQGVNQRWVTPTQISSWDSKAAGTHIHAIAQITGLQSALDGKALTSHTHSTADVTGLDGTLLIKQDFLNPSYFDAADLVVMSNTVEFQDYPHFFADLGGADITVNANGFVGGFSHDRFTAVIRNTSGSPQNVTLNFDWIDTGNPANHPIVAAGGFITVGINDILVIDGGFVKDDANQTVFVGYLENKNI